MRKSTALTAAFLITITLTSCGILPVGSEAELNGSAWILESYSGRGVIPNTTMTAFFEAGEIRGSASCNTYFGSYQSKGDQLKVEGLGWTEMACMDPTGVMEQEQEIMALLSKTVSYSIEGEKLHLQTEAGGELIFTALSPRDQ